MMMLPSNKALWCIFLAHQNHDTIKSNTSCISSSTRRCFLGSTAASFLLFGQPPPPQALAVEEDADVSMTKEDPLYLARPIGIRSSSSNDGDNAVARPSAPIEFLLPATRVGLYIYQLLGMAEELAQIKKDKSRLSSPSNAHQKESELIDRIEKLLVSSPPTFIKSTDPTVTRRDPYNNKLPLLGEIAIQQQKQKERKEQYTNVGITPQLFEVGELMGERSQWNRLVQAEKRRENDSEIRRAFNIYTTNLNFNPNKYVYRGSKEEKKMMIREGRLPSTNDVIRSDLDARDLYRNVVQTAVDDARAEFVYQKRVGFDEDDDGSELVRLLNDAKSAVDSWFGFIPDEDVKLAIEVVKNEMEMEQK
ncbi:hypothetical protein ACHAWC_010726 [Mediolabrus comicus]